MAYCLKKVKRFCYEMRYSLPRDAGVSDERCGSLPHKGAGKTYGLLSGRGRLVSIAQKISPVPALLSLLRGSYGYLADTVVVPVRHIDVAALVNRHA
jgi:hypothetical protein